MDKLVDRPDTAFTRHRLRLSGSPKRFAITQDSYRLRRSANAFPSRCHRFPPSGNRSANQSDLGRSPARPDLDRSDLQDLQYGRTSQPQCGRSAPAAHSAPIVLNYFSSQVVRDPTSLRCGGPSLIVHISRRSIVLFLWPGHLLQRGQLTVFGLVWPAETHWCKPELRLNTESQSGPVGGLNVLRPSGGEDFLCSYQGKSTGRPGGWLRWAESWRGRFGRRRAPTRLVLILFGARRASSRTTRLPFRSSRSRRSIGRR